MPIDALDAPGTEEMPSGEDLDTDAADMDDDIDNQSDSPEFALEDHDVEGWEDVESNTADDNALNPESEDDDRDTYD